jgi:hypothetical protein
MAFANLIAGDCRAGGLSTHKTYNPAQPISVVGRYEVADEFIKEEKDFPSVKCFEAGYEFLDANRKADNWLLQIETFDPHEPFFAPDRFKDKFPTDYDGPILDWPRYERVTEPQDQIDELRANYFALLSLCDDLLGRSRKGWRTARRYLRLKFTLGDVADSSMPHVGSYGAVAHQATQASFGAGRERGRRPRRTVVAACSGIRVGKSLRASMQAPSR